MIENFIYHVPVKIVFGVGKVSEIGAIAKSYGKKALIVTTGSSSTKNGLVGRVQEYLLSEGLQSEHYGDVSPNPSSFQIDKGAGFGMEKCCDVVIGLGGGSAIDAAKAMAVVMGHNIPIWNFAAGCVENPMDISQKTLPILAVTTTSGTGSHITCYSVVNNEKTREKPGIGSPNIFPRAAIVDPELMVSMPSKITAATGFDILAHSLEAYTSNSATPMTDLFCEEAIRLVGKYLARAVRDGSDIEARSALAYADTLAGFAISVAVVTLCHAAAHAVGGVCHTVHGEVLAVLTPYFIDFSMRARPEKYKKLGMLLRNENVPADKSEAELLNDSKNEIRKLIEAIRLETRLSSLGIKESDLEAIAKGTVGYMGGAVELDPRKASMKDVLDILKEAF